MRWPRPPLKCSAPTFSEWKVLARYWFDVYLGCRRIRPPRCASLKTSIPSMCFFRLSGSFTPRKTPRVCQAVVGERSKTQRNEYSSDDGRLALRRRLRSVRKHRCKRQCLPRCKRRCAGASSGDNGPGTAAALVRRTEAAIGAASLVPGAIVSQGARRADVSSAQLYH